MATSAQRGGGQGRFWTIFILVVAAFLAAIMGLAWKALEEFGSDSAAVVMTGLGFCGASVAFFIGKALEFWYVRQAAITERKQEAYRALVSPWFDILMSGRAPGGVKPEDMRAFLDAATKGAFNTLLFGSDEVLREFVRFRLLNMDQSVPMEVRLAGWGRLFKAIRKDIGHTGDALSATDMLSVFINFTPEERHAMDVASADKVLADRGSTKE